MESHTKDLFPAEVYVEKEHLTSGDASEAAKPSSPPNTLAN